MQWDGGDAVVKTGVVKTLRRTKPPVRYIEVHVPGEHKLTLRKVCEDPRLLDTSESSSSSDSGEGKSP
eukprot:COSAG04_NODE_16643_length_493_cov_0.629442_1_plen_67_part_01